MTLNTHQTLVSTTLRWLYTGDGSTKTNPDCNGKINRVFFAWWWFRTGARGGCDRAAETRGAAN